MCVCMAVPDDDVIIRCTEVSPIACVLCLFQFTGMFVVPASMSFGNVTNLANKCVNNRAAVTLTHTRYLAAVGNNRISSVVHWYLTL